MAEQSKNECSPAENIIVAADQGRLDLITTLLEDGADPNTVDKTGTSALHNAAKWGNEDIARLLLEKGASPRIEDGSYTTPLQYAIKAGHIQMVRLILDYDPTICESAEVDAGMFLRVAALFGHIEIVQLLLDNNAPSLDRAGESTALHYAAMKGHHDICDLLLRHDKSLNRSLWARVVGPSLEVDTKDYAGQIPFLHAVERRHLQTVEVFLRHYPNLTKACETSGSLLFHDAVRRRDIKMVRIFLDNGADVEMEDHAGQRALHVAVTTGNNTRTVLLNQIVEMVQLLLARGAAVDVKDKSGSTPESLTQHQNIRMLLRDHQASKGEPATMTPPISAPPPEYQE